MKRRPCVQAEAPTYPPRSWSISRQICMGGVTGLLVITAVGCLPQKQQAVVPNAGCHSLTLDKATAASYRIELTILPMAGTPTLDDKALLDAADAVLTHHTAAELGDPTRSQELSDEIKKVLPLVAGRSLVLGVRYVSEGTVSTVDPLPPEQLLPEVTAPVPKPEGTAPRRTGGVAPHRLKQTQTK